jgi:hypothetical protein
MGRCRLITEEESKVKGSSERKMNIVDPTMYVFVPIVVCLPTPQPFFVLYSIDIVIVI